MPERVAASAEHRGSGPVAALVAAATAAVATLLIGVVRVADHPFWLDEASSANVVNRSFPGLVRVLGSQAAGMFSFHSGLWIWAQTFGDSDVALRMFSVLGGVVAVALVVWLTARWFGVAVAVLAGTLLLANPFFLRYLTELRGYSWAMALSIGGVWALDQLFENDRRRDAVLLGVIIGVALANHVLALAALIPLGLALWRTSMLTAERLRRHLAAVVIPAVVLALPAAPALLKGSGATEWIPAPAIEPIRLETEKFLGGWWWGATLLVGIVAATAHVVRQRAASWRIVAAVTTTWLTLPLMLALSFVRPVYIARYAAPAFPLVMIAAAFGFGCIARWIDERFGYRPTRSSVPSLRVVALGAVAAVVAVSFMADQPLEDKPRLSDSRAAAELILERIQPGDKVAVSHFALPLVRYLGERPDIDPAHRPHSDTRLHNRKKIDVVLEELRAAPVVYVFGWESKGLRPQLAALAAERNVTIERFGLATVWILS